MMSKHPELTDLFDHYSPLRRELAKANNRAGDRDCLLHGAVILQREKAHLKGGCCGRKQLSA
jgi:hypothetical protein